MQVNRAAGFTFASAMRNFLRHDPDVIMVGEIRDQETADIAVESALTGHLLLSTLHTNTAATTVTRLLDLGVEAYLLRASLLAVMSQRLVRLTCATAATSEAVDPHVRAVLGVGPDEVFHVGRGCSHCDGLGVHKRRAVYELMVVIAAHPVADRARRRGRHHPPRGDRGRHGADHPGRRAPGPRRRDFAGRSLARPRRLKSGVRFTYFRVWRSRDQPTAGCTRCRSG